MKQKNLDEIRNAFFLNKSNEKKEKSIDAKYHKNKINYNHNISNENDELSMRNKIFNLSNKFILDKLISSNLTNKNDKAKINLKFFFQQQNNYKNKIINNDENSNNSNKSHQKNNLLLMDKKKYNKNAKNLVGNNNFFNNNHDDLSLKNNKNDLDIKLFSFYSNKKNLINNIYSFQKNAEEKRKVISKSGNKNKAINYRKYLFNEKLDSFNIKNKKDINENKNFKLNDMEHKGLFYLYNLQNNIYNHNKKKSDNYPTFNIFNQTNNITNNITYITKSDNSNKDRPIILFPKSFNNSLNKKNKYNTLNNRKTKSNFNDIFINTTNKIKAEENIFHNKMKLRKQNYKKKYLNILTQNDSDSSRKKNKNMNNNFLTMKNFENAEKKLKLKLIKFMNNNKTEALLKNNKNKKNNLLDIKNISKNNNNSSLNNISEISKVSTVMRDSKYYMNKSSELIKYIQTFYSKNKSYPETKINFYLYGRRIGQGAFGKVNLGLNVLTGRVVAIKSFKTTPIEKFQHRMKKIQYETELMKRFNHKNITKILEVFNDEEYMLIIMEYINGGNLFSFVKKRRKLSEKMAKFLFRQIILGIQHIHSKNVVHRDIKLENILIDFDNNVKICDFGIGKVLENEDELLYDKCGTPMYMAPEIILANDDNGYKGFPVDIWSSGITLYIMLSGSLPFNIKNKNNNKEDMALNSIKDKNNIFLQNQIVNVKPKEIENISIEAKNLLKGLLNKNPSKRLTCSQILNHPWLKHSNNNMDSLNLFTKAELTMMSKTYIDYRKGELEDLKENFTLSNLRNDEIKLEEKNITTKSTILDPFNSCINNDNNSSNNDLVIMEDSFDDFKNENIKLENDIMIFNNKVKEFNLNFEVNNNQEVDNGMIIKTQSDNVSSSSSMNNSLSLNDISKDFIEEKNNNKKNELNVDKNILNEIEQYGYDKKYVLNCIENNKLCHASTVFYLLKNYKDIE